MKKTILFLMVLGLSLINAHTIRAFEFKDQPIVEGITNCTPSTIVNVYLINKPLEDPCTDCSTWYISVYEWDGNTGYKLVGNPKAFNSGPTYTWTNVSWDFTSYPCLVMIWRYNNEGGSCSCSSLNDKTTTFCPANPVDWTKYDFYPD